MRRWWPLLILGLAACAHRAPMKPSIPAAPILSPGKAAVIKLTLENPPTVGSTPSGVAFSLGGFKGLRFLNQDDDGILRFAAITSHGPVGALLTTGERPKHLVPLPDYQPRIVILRADLEKNSLTVERQILLVRADGKALSGLPPIGSIEAATMDGAPLPPDPFGTSPNGLAIAADGSFWTTDLYTASLLHFSDEGRLLESMRAGNGLPRSMAGESFGGIAVKGTQGYAILQEPLAAKSLSGKNSGASRIVRLVELNLAEHETLAQYAYRLQGAAGGYILDASVLAPGKLIITEQELSGARKNFRVGLAKASDLQLMPEKINAALEEMNAAQMKAAEISLASKVVVMDLAKSGLPAVRIGGVDEADPFLAVISDNAFGVPAVKASKTELYLLPITSSPRK